jgi:Lon protease-like protein
VTTLDYSPGAHLAPLPVFPLPEAVLFPGALMPLHIFEPRYRRMTEDAIADNRTLCIAQILTASERDVHGHPRIVKVVGVGEIVRHERLPDGRFHILLRGRARARVDELPFDPPYRRVRATLIGDEGGAEAGDVAALVLAATRFANLLRGNGEDRELELPPAARPAALVDACAHQLVVTGEDRQMLLEEVDVGARVRACTEMLAVQEALISQRGMLN